MDPEPFKCPEGWSMHRSVLYRAYKNPKPASSFAIFDMDSTLMISPSHYVPDLVRGLHIPAAKPAITEDFALFAPNEREKLQNELNNGRGLLVVSNQRGLLEDLPLANKILGVLLFFERELNGGVPIDRSTSFYVGDAAGRRLPYRRSSVMLRNVMNVLKAHDFSNHRYFNMDSNGNLFQVDASAIIDKLTISKMRNICSHDFSDCDLKFAKNNGLEFYTPDEYFYDLPPFDLKVDFEPLSVGSDPYFPSVQSGLVVMIGNISSGKSYMAREFKGFKTISQSDFNSEEEFMSTLKEMLSRGLNVVVDDPNHLSSHRVRLVNLAASLGVQVTFVHLKLSSKLIAHLNKIKRLSSDDATSDYFEVLERSTRFYKKGDLNALKVQTPTLDEGPNVIYTLTDESFPFVHTSLTSLYLP